MGSFTFSLMCTALLALSNCISSQSPCPAENRGVCISEVQLYNQPSGDIDASVELYVQSEIYERNLFVVFDTLARETATIPVLRTGPSFYRLINATLHLSHKDAIAVLVATEKHGVLDGVVLTHFPSTGASTLANRFGISVVETGIGSVSVSRCGQYFNRATPSLGQENSCYPSSGETDLNDDEEDSKDSMVKATASQAVRTNEVIKQTTPKARSHSTHHIHGITHSIGNTRIATTKRTGGKSHKSTKQTPISSSKPKTMKSTKASSRKPSTTTIKRISSTSTKTSTPTYILTMSRESSNPDTSSTTKVHRTTSIHNVTNKRTVTPLPSSSSSTYTKKPSPVVTQSTKLTTKKRNTSKSPSSLSTQMTVNPGQASTSRSNVTSSTATTRSSVKPSSTLTTRTFVSPSSTISISSVNPKTTTTVPNQKSVKPTKTTTAKPATGTSTTITKHSGNPSRQTTSRESSAGPPGTATTTPSGESSTKPNKESTTGPSEGPSSGHTSPLRTTQRSESTSSETTGSTRAPYKLTVSISEVNILLDKDVNKTFIELQGPHHMTLVNHSLVMFDGQSKATLYHKRFLDETFTGSGFFLVEGFKITRSTKSIVIGLYDNRKWLQPYGKHIPVSAAKGLLDSFAIRTTTDSLDGDIMENLLPTHADRVFTIKPRLAEAAGMTVSRCANTLMDPGSFLLSFPTPGATNNCTLRTGHRIQFKLTDADCKDFRNPKLQVELVDYLVKSVNQRCLCGLTDELVTERKYMCGSLIFEAYIRASTDWQANAIFSSYHDFVTDATKDVVIGGQRYIADTSCVRDCMPPPLNPNNKSSGDTTLTVAIVVSCVGAFMIVAIGVVIYIRRKKKSIVTFRLTNLGEMDTSNMLHEDRDDIAEEDNSTFRSIALVTA